MDPAPAAASPFATAGQRSAQRESKRDALLLAAVRMFNARGFHATSLEDVAASLGVTKPVIYHYLGNKDQVLLECVRMGCAQLRGAAAEARRQPGSGLDRLRHFLIRYAEVNMVDFGACVIRTGDEALAPASRADVRALKRGIDEAMRGLVAAAAADGSARIPDVRTAAFLLAGALNWPARWYRADGASSPREIATAMVDLLCAGLDPITLPPIEAA